MQKSRPSVLTFMPSCEMDWTRQTHSLDGMQDDWRTYSLECIGMHRSKMRGRVRTHDARFPSGAKQRTPTPTPPRPHPGRGWASGGRCSVGCERGAKEQLFSGVAAWSVTRVGRLKYGFIDDE